MQNRKFFILIGWLGFLFGCYKEEQVTPNEVIISMTGDKSTIPADGVSKQLITIEIPATTADANNTITLITTKGLFDVVNKNTTTVTAQNIIINGVVHKVASVNLVSSTDEGAAYVSATIKNYTQIDTIFFTKAYPEQIKIAVDKLNYQISNTGEVVVTVKVSRLPGNGTPTPGQTITLVALDNAQNPIGRFRNLNNTTDAAGTCINYFSIPLTNPYLGPVKLLTTVQKSITGNTITDSVFITAY
jgi:hypothetical protein